MDNKELEMAKEVERIYIDTLDYKASYRQVLEIYKKAHSLATTQENEPIKTINEIIPPGADLDNGEIYDIETGVIIRRLEDGF